MFTVGQTVLIQANNGMHLRSDKIETISSEKIYLKNSTGMIFDLQGQAVNCDYHLEAE